MTLKLKKSIKTEEGAYPQKLELQKEDTTTTERTYYLYKTKLDYYELL